MEFDISRIAENAVAGLRKFLHTPFDLEVRFALFYIMGTALLAFVIWMFRKDGMSFLAWLFPKSVYLHRSNLLDIKLFVVNRLMATTGAFGALLFSPFIAYLTLSALSGEMSPIMAAEVVTWQTSLLVTFLVVVSTDFCKYWSHRIMHEWQFLWPFHAVHHSAEVLTPLTLVRAHPMDIIFRNVIISVVVGATQGVVVFLFVGDVGLMTIGGANAITFFVNLLGANLRHSHIWLSFGRVIEHILISPAQHQIHHSSAVEHHDKNYGSLFAVWDWAFGTLYIPRKREQLEFGLSDGQGITIPQPHSTLRKALFHPFGESLDALRPRQNSPDQRDERPGA